MIPALAGAVQSLRQWALEVSDCVSPYCIFTKYGRLAFFKDQIDGASSDEELESLLIEKINLAKSDGEERRAARAVRAAASET